MRLTMAAVWFCVVMTCTSLGVLKAGLLVRHGDATQKNAQVETIKLPPVSVPLLSEGEVRGYILARFAAVVAGRDASAKIDVYIIDEIFRSLYGLAPRQVQTDETGQIATLTKGIIDRVNTRLGASQVRELLVLEWTWVSKQDARN